MTFIYQDFMEPKDEPSSSPRNEDITDGRDHADWVIEQREKFERMDRYDESGYWRHFR